MGAHFKALDEGVLLVPLDPMYTQVGFNLVSVQVCVYQSLAMGGGGKFASKYHSLHVEQKH